MQVSGLPLFVIDGEVWTPPGTENIRGSSSVAVKHLGYLELMPSKIVIYRYKKRILNQLDED